MSPLVGIVFMSCVTVVPVAMRYTEYPSDHYDVDPSSVVFPSSLKSPFSEPARFMNVSEGLDLKQEYIFAVEALFAVTTRLKVLLGYDSSRNLVVSPISTTTALAEVLLGATGPSRRHLLNILTTVNRSADSAEATVVQFHKQLGGLIKYLQGSSGYNDAYKLHLASSLFLEPDVELLPTFRHALMDLYGVDVIPLNFSGDPLGSLSEMNQWSEFHTNGVIKKVFSHPLPKTTAAVLINSIYFKGDWETPFNPRFTVPGKFKSSDTRTVDVEFMQAQMEVMYAENKRLNCRMIALPYKHARAAMYVILPDIPDKYNIQEFVAGLSISDVRELINTTKLRSVSVAMPKMKLAQTLSIRQALSNFGTKSETGTRSYSQGMFIPQEPEIDPCDVANTATTATGEGTEKTTATSEKGDIGEVTNRPSDLFDLSGASKDHRFRVDDIIHNIFLEITELGTEAAAVTTTLVDYIGDYRNFVMDRPFLFFIRHEITGTPLFWGTVVDPVNSGTT